MVSFNNPASSSLANLYPSQSNSKKSNFGTVTGNGTPSLLSGNSAFDKTSFSTGLPGGAQTPATGSDQSTDALKAWFMSLLQSMMPDNSQAQDASSASTTEGTQATEGGKKSHGGNRFSAAQDAEGTEDTDEADDADETNGANDETEGTDGEGGGGKCGGG